MEFIFAWRQKSKFIQVGIIVLDVSGKPCPKYAK